MLSHFETDAQKRPAFPGIKLAGSGVSAARGAGKSGHEPKKEQTMLHIETPLAATPVPAPLPAAARADGSDRLAPIHQPFPRLIGVEITEAEPTRVRARLQVRPDLCRSGHVMHGGATMAFADMVASIGAFLNLPEGAATTTIESKTNFIGPAKEGTIVEAEAVPLHSGRRSSVWQTTIKREDGKLVAVVIQTQMVI
jgi:uncharacterized protein (TIGR00369 family)